MPDVTMVYSESRGTWNVFVDGEWYYEGDYEQCCDVCNRCADDLQDDYYDDDNSEWGGRG